MKPAPISELEPGDTFTFYSIPKVDFVFVNYDRQTQMAAFKAVMSNLLFSVHANPSFTVLIAK